MIRQKDDRSEPRKDLARMISILGIRFLAWAPTPATQRYGNRVTRRGFPITRWPSSRSLDHPCGFCRATGGDFRKLTVRKPARHLLVRITLRNDRRYLSGRRMSLACARVPHSNPGGTITVYLRMRTHRRSSWLRKR